MPSTASQLIDPPPLPLSDEEVVARVLAGETALFEIIMRRYNQRLFRVARGILKNDEEAEDAVQQAYLSAYSALRQFSGTAQFSTWLTRIALNEAFGRTRRRIRMAEVDLEDGDQMEDPSAPASPEDRATSRELTSLLEAAIDGLPEIYRVVVMMREVQELSTAETASCLELSEVAVKVRLHRARALLRESMAERMTARGPEAFAFLGARCDRIVHRVMTELGCASSRGNEPVGLASTKPAP